MRVVDDGGGGGDQHQVIRRRWTSDLREVPVAKGVSLRITPIVGDIRPTVLLMCRAGRALEPGRVLVRMVGCRRIGGRRQISVTVDARKSAEVVVEGMVLLDDDHHMVDRAFRQPALDCSFPHPGTSLWAVWREKCFDRRTLFQNAASLKQPVTGLRYVSLNCAKAGTTGRRRG